MPRVLAVALLSGIDFGFDKYSKPDIQILFYLQKLMRLFPTDSVKTNKRYFDSGAKRLSSLDHFANRIQEYVQ